MSEDVKTIPSCKEYRISKDGAVYNKRGKKLSSYTNKGYYFIGLCNNKERKNFCIHRLVYEAWGGKLKAGLWVNHKDGNKANNHINNLELITPGENHEHAFRTGLHCHKGGKNPFSKLKESDIPKIREMKTLGFSQRKIAEEFNVTQPTINLVLTGKGWTHL